MSARICVLTGIFALRDKEANESWKIFKTSFLWHKSSQSQPATNEEAERLNEDLLACEYYGDMTQEHEECVRNTKAQLYLNLVRDIKNNRSFSSTQNKEYR